MAPYRFEHRRECNVAYGIYNGQPPSGQSDFARGLSVVGLLLLAVAGAITGGLLIGMVFLVTRSPLPMDVWGLSGVLIAGACLLVITLAGIWAFGRLLGRRI